MTTKTFIFIVGDHEFISNEPFGPMFKEARQLANDLSLPLYRKKIEESLDEYHPQSGFFTAVK